jgi:hypothetical protein
MSRPFLDLMKREARGFAPTGDQKRSMEVLEAPVATEEVVDEPTAVSSEIEDIVEDRSENNFDTRDLEEKTFKRAISVEFRSQDEDRILEFPFASEAPVERYYGMEVLKHGYKIHGSCTFK